MRFAIVGEHPDGWNMACALVASGRHDFSTCAGLSGGQARLGELLLRFKFPEGVTPKPVGDFEEVLADPSIEMVIVADGPGSRPAQLRRALQSERHVLSVYPPDQTPDLVYEAALIQGDTRKVLLPLLTGGLHPAIARLAELIGSPAGSRSRILQMERRLLGPLFADSAKVEVKAALREWSLLRALAGEIAEVSAFAAGEEIDPGEPLLLSCRFASGVLAHLTLLPEQKKSSWRLSAIGAADQIELTFPDEASSAARLTWIEESGAPREENWAEWNPWPQLVEVFEAALDPKKSSQSLRPTWQDAIRCQELDDALRRSIARRRSSILEYPEANEEVGFKGAMTLVGCGVLWGILGLFILSAWIPWLRWVVVPILIIFLGLQSLRWIIPAKRPQS